MVIDSCSNTNRPYVILPLGDCQHITHYNVPNYNIDYDIINKDLGLTELIVAPPGFVIYLSVPR